MNRNMDQITLGWLFCTIFLALGVLNALFISVIFGLFYVSLSVIYAPPTDRWTKYQFNLVIPFYLKVVIALLILWATLAVGDLAEYFGL